MSQLKFSDLIDTPEPLSPAEAVALTLAVDDALNERSMTSVPSEALILLSSTGRVSLEGVSNADVEDKPRDSKSAQLAVLTRKLLQLDKRGSVERRKRVPTALLGALARATTHTDLPRPTEEEFRTALQRVGAPDPTTLAAVFWRAARLCAAARVPATPAASATQVKADATSTQRVSEERRQNVPAPSDLRRYLRETERELFEARACPEGRRNAPAETVEVAPVESVPAVPPVAPRGRIMVSRFWRVSAGIAATVVGAVAGVVLAFTMAGRVDVLKRQIVSPTPLPTVVSVTASPAKAVHGPAEPVQAQARPHRTASGRTAQPLLLAPAVGADVFSPSFAPRGRTIFFHAGREGAPLMRASVNDTGEVNLDGIETLLDDGAANYHVTMSPDGSRIAYDSDRDGVRGVYVANADGSDPRRISGEGYGAVPSWSPDGERVAFVRAEPGRNQIWNVWIAEPGSGALHRVTSHSSGQPWGASWFPDGQRLAYSLEDRLMVADLSTGLGRGYRSPRDGRVVRTPAVSPDGRRIVFQVRHDGVWLLDLEHARMRRILADETAEEFVWAPDGNAIAYHARKGGSYGLWKLSLSN
jgi:Tol biopolymer transport system component